MVNTSPAWAGIPAVAAVSLEKRVRSVIGRSPRACSVMDFAPAGAGKPVGDA
jgi:hypothetical protein